MVISYRIQWTSDSNIFTSVKLSYHGRIGNIEKHANHFCEFSDMLRPLKKHLSCV